MKAPWRRPQPVVTGVEPECVSTCYFHGPEATDRHDFYRLCGECGHVWDIDDLLDQHNTITATFGQAPTKPRHVDSIDICPLCGHDF